MNSSVKQEQLYKMLDRLKQMSREIPPIEDDFVTAEKKSPRLSYPLTLFKAEYRPLSLKIWPPLHYTVCSTKYQQRLPYDLLSTIAHLLMDCTVFEIVKELIDLQYMSEKHLYQQRSDIMIRHRSERTSMIKAHREEILNARCQGRAHVLIRLPTLHKEQISQMETRHSDEISKFDRRVLQVIDEKVEEQQSTLEQVGLPGFKKTMNPVELKVQMYILSFILKLGNIKTGPN